MPNVSPSSADKAIPSAPEIRAGSAVVSVMVVDKHGSDLMPTCPKRARLLLKEKRADVFCKNPFTIRILDREGGVFQPVELKLDPGSKVTGAALMVRGEVRGWFAVAAWEIHHRGHAIRDALLSRSRLRRGRRSRKTRYRPPRFKNRTRAKGWLAPSLQSRVNNLIAFMNRLIRVCPVSEIPVEQVRFDTQLMANPDIQGVQYQQGALAGYEVREYLLEKWRRQCVYCKAKDLPLQIEHLIPRSRGGTDKISNLALACNRCNQKKGNQLLEVFLHGKPELLAFLNRQAKQSPNHKDLAAVNATRLALVKRLENTFPHLIVSTWTGGHTKFNRTQQGLPKTHWLDAACVGDSGQAVDVSGITHITSIHAKGRGSRQMCKPDKHGFPRTKAKSVKRLHGFQTGDRVKLNKPSGKHKGTYEGTVSIRATGMFDIKSTQGLKVAGRHDRFTLMSRFDGYAYTHQRVG